MKYKKAVAFFGGKTIFLILIIAILFFSFNYLSVGNIVNGIPEQTETTTWEGIPVELKSSYFGSATSGSTTDICGDNDGKVSISNTYGDSKLFSLSSTQSGEKGCATQWQNYIEAKMTIPAGRKLIGYSDNSGNSPEGRGSQIHSQSIVSIKRNSIYLFVDDLLVPARTGTGQSSNNFEMTFEEPTEIIIKAQSYGVGGGGYSNARIYFELEDEIITQDEIPPETQDPIISPVETSLNFIDKINLYIKSLFDWIFGWFR